MIVGKVANFEAVIDVEAFGQDGSVLRIQAIVDSGYNGHLTLPPEDIEALVLPMLGQRRAYLADGSLVEMKAFQATIKWHDEIKGVLVSQTEGAALVGMRLLSNCQLTMTVVEGGDVTIIPLASTA